MKDASPSGERGRRGVEAWLIKIQPRRLAIFELLVITSVVAAGGVRGLFGLDIHVIDLNAEATAPAVFSAALLLFAAVAAFALLDASSRFVVAGLPTLFALLAVDEIVGIHEALDDATGIAWQILYLPVFAYAAVAARTLLRSLPNRDPARHLFIAGVGAWVASQVFDLIQNHGAGELMYPALIVPEELLEMLGSGLVGLALLVLLRARAGKGPGAGTPDRGTHR